MFSVTVIGEKDAAAALAEAGWRVQVRSVPVLQHYGQLYQSRVRAAASGRPGPRAITGDYRRSITLEMGMHDGLPSAIVGTVSPQGRRLEYGYVDVDSLGRRYNQPPFPHFDPPLAAVVEELTSALADLVTDDAGPGR
ncbi:MAG: hypothetical protein LC798_16790 [Chloroflexi bacterium]|nr:hypothetical protein [Chloroflexota bacterium]